MYPLLKPGLLDQRYIFKWRTLVNVQEVLLKNIKQPKSQDFPVHLLLHLRIGIFYLLQRVGESSSCDWFCMKGKISYKTRKNGTSGRGITSNNIIDPYFHHYLFSFPMFSHRFSLIFVSHTTCALKSNNSFCKKWFQWSYNFCEGNFPKLFFYFGF